MCNQTYSESGAIQTMVKCKEFELMEVDKNILIKVIQHIEELNTIEEIKIAIRTLREGGKI